jgi:pSer/pThr/pTyr-binding forkhead associated (FHA) protein
MRITDISVSRIHATIAYKNGKFLLYDNASKFGTLVRIPQKLSLSEDRCAIQVGRTVLVCSVKPLSLLKAKKEEGLSIKELQSTRA